MAADPRDLISVAEYQEAAGGTDAPKIQRAITDASVAVMNYAQRSFRPLAAPDDPSARTFPYDASGYVEIDDAREVSLVKLNGSTLVASTSTQINDYTAEPYAEPVSTYLRIYVASAAGGESPEMGFTRNLDRLWWRRRPHSIVEVTAKWGWSEVPPDVKRATIIVVAAFLESPSPFLSRSIEGYSVALPTPLVEGIPERAQALLAPYARHGAI